jgi:hypothetical protein
MKHSQAVVNAILTVLAQQFPRSVPSSMVLGRWAGMGDLMEREFPDWRNHWGSIMSADKACHQVLTDEIVGMILKYFDFNHKQTLKFMNPSPNDYSSTVLGVLYMMSHGRLPTPECYTLTSALGAEHIAKCWRMAAHRKRLQNRRNDPQMGLMAQIYQYLSAQAFSYHRGASTKQEVANAIHSASCAFIELNDQEGSADLGEFPTHFLTSPNQREVYYYYYYPLEAEEYLISSLG